MFARPANSLKTLASREMIAPSNPETKHLGRFRVWRPLPRSETAMARAGRVADAYAYPDQTLGRAGPHLAPLLFIPRPGGAAQSRQLPIIHPGSREHAFDAPGSHPRPQRGNRRRQLLRAEAAIFSLAPALPA